MIAALLLADLALVVAVSTFAMLVYYLIANIAALRLPQKHRQYPSWVPVIGAMSLYRSYRISHPEFVDHRVYRASDWWDMVCFP